MKKDIRNIDTIARTLRPASTKVTNDRLEVARKEKREKKEIKKRWKAEAMVAKRCRARGGMSLSNKEEDKSDTGNDTDPDQAKDEYQLQL